eukprot:7660282-Pyramimonas_sp.AAC.1
MALLMSSVAHDPMRESSRGRRPGARPRLDMSICEPSKMLHRARKRTCASSSASMHMFPDKGLQPVTMGAAGFGARRRMTPWSLRKFPTAPAASASSAVSASR